MTRNSVEFDIYIMDQYNDESLVCRCPFSAGSMREDANGTVSESRHHELSETVPLMSTFRNRAVGIFAHRSGREQANGARGAHHCIDLKLGRVSCHRKVVTHWNIGKGWGG